MAQLMNIGELAEYLKLEKQTIYNWLHEKKISGIKVGHVWRFDRSSVNRWLKSRTVNAVPKRGKKSNIKRTRDIKC